MSKIAKSWIERTQSWQNFHAARWVLVRESTYAFISAIAFGFNVWIAFTLGGDEAWGLAMAVSFLAGITMMILILTLVRLGDARRDFIASENMLLTVPWPDPPQRVGSSDHQPQPVSDASRPSSFSR
jgi:hypothetical protein